MCEDVAGVPQGLQAVQVHDRAQGREPVVPREHGRLPDLALVALGVAEQGEDAGGRVLAGARP